MNARRDPILTGWLIFLLVVHAVIAYRSARFYVEWWLRGPFTYPGGLFALQTLLGVGGMVGALWLLRGRRRGLYLIAAVSVLMLLFNLLLGVPPNAALVGLVNIGVSIVLLQPRWKILA